MARPRTIVGIGEVNLADRPDGITVVGLAAEVARAASRIGHVGVAVSRIGQDTLGTDVIESLRTDGVDVSHVQTDPDYSTGRLLNPLLRRAEVDGAPNQAAYTNLQWDYDLVDLAQRADVVIFGTVVAQHSQARSVIQQFLYECRAALRIIDLTNRGPDFDRGTNLALAADADLAIVDRDALNQMVPAGNSDDDRIGRLLREASLNLILMLGEDEVRVCSDGQSWSAQLPEHRLSTTALLRFIVALLGGDDMDASVALLSQA